jgi:hypothetical protein
MDVTATGTQDVRMTRSVVAAVALSLYVLVGATSAGAATQIGSTFAPTSNCNLAAWLHAGQPAGSPAGPFSGVITSWSFQAANPAPDLNFKLARPTTGDMYVIVGQSGVRDMAVNTLNTVPAQIPAQAGDLIGYHTATAGNCKSFVPGYAIAFYPGVDDPAVGSENSFPPLPGQRLDISATLEADADCDGLGDETQDPSVDPAGCNPPPPEPLKGNRTVALEANKGKVKRGKRVKLSGRVSSASRQGACAVGQTVELQRKKPSQSSFSAFVQLQSDAQGRFSLKLKVKKTFEFRAQLAETAACAAALSNSETVKVKRKR